MEPGQLIPPVLCLVTSGAGSPDLHAIHQAALTGVDLIQIREPRLGGRALLAVVRGALAASAGTRARVTVNERLDVALAAGAAGVHLRGDSMAAADVRRIAPDAFLIGRSVHSLAEAVAAERGGGCDYLTFGTVFPTTSKPAGHTSAGLGALEELCAAVALPVLAIGGISVANAAAIAAARAGGVAAITLFAGEAGLAERIRAVRRSFDTCYPRKK